MLHALQPDGERLGFAHVLDQPVVAKGQRVLQFLGQLVGLPWLQNGANNSEFMHGVHVCIL